MGYIAYKRRFMNIISIIFITSIPHPGVMIYYLRLQSFLLKIFILFFYFPVLYLRNVLMWLHYQLS